MKIFKFTSFFIFIFLFLNLITPTKAFALKFTENFDSYSTGEITAQSNWYAPIDYPSPYENSIVKNNVYSSSPNSLHQEGRGFIMQDLTTTTPNDIYVSVDIYHTSALYNTSFTTAGNAGELIGIIKMGNNTTIYIAGENVTPITNKFEEWQNIKIKANYDGAKYHYEVYSDNSLIKEGDTGTKTKRDLNLVGLDNSAGSGEISKEYYDNIVVATNEDVPVGDTRTRIIEITPAHHAVIATTTPTGATTTLAVEYYINEEDVGIFNTMKIFIEHKDQNKLIDDTYEFEEKILPLAGSGYWDREIFLPIGNYSIEVQILNTTMGGLFYNPFTYKSNSIFMSTDDRNLLAQYHQYVIGESTFLGGLTQGWNDEFEQILAGTSTGPKLADCNILYKFDFANCMAFTFIPKKEQLTLFASKISENVFTKFPAGYIWSLGTILNSTTTTPLPIISAIIPQGVAGTGAEIELAIHPGDLDFIYNATTSTFSNESVNGEVNFYEYTYYYWKILVYLGVFLYIFNRILGSNVAEPLGEMFNIDLNVNNNTAHGRIRKDARGKYYQEWNKADIKKALSKGDHNKSEML